MDPEKGPQILHFMPVLLCSHHFPDVVLLWAVKVCESSARRMRMVLLHRWKGKPIVSKNGASHAFGERGQCKSQESCKSVSKSGLKVAAGNKRRRSWGKPLRSRIKLRAHLAFRVGLSIAQNVTVSRERERQVTNVDPIPCCKASQSCTVAWSTLLREARKLCYHRNKGDLQATIISIVPLCWSRGETVQARFKSQ